MQLSFGMPEVNTWAQFSSDYNPIHFDLEHARVAGLDTLIVHGMLALMPVKRHVGGAGGSGWMRFRALFRSPIAHDGELRLASTAKEGGVAFRLQAADSTQEHFRGVYQGVGDPSAEVEAERALFVEHTALSAAHGARFAEFYPDVGERWIALDAIVFAEFIGAKLALIEAMAESKMRAMPGAATGRKVVVQVSHEVQFDADYFAGAAAAGAGLDELAYAMKIGDFMASGNQLVGAVTIPVFAGARLVMLMEIGLMAKFKPAD